jgi:hypothetical protein
VVEGNILIDEEPPPYRDVPLRAKLDSATEQSRSSLFLEGRRADMSRVVFAEN